ncbi:MAG: futalosine hydrolase [Bacteroidota bacterium]
MKVLLVAATAAEVQPVLDRIGSGFGNRHLSTLIAGVGMTAFTHALTKRLSEEKFDLILNVGIAGSFDPALPLCSVVAVVSDCFYELGAEDGTEFIPADRLGLVSTVHVSPEFPGPIGSLPAVKGITVSRVHGEDASIALALQRAPAQVESMEGASFYYVCNKEHVPCLQIRAISNRVERRNRADWNIPGALHALADAVNDYLQSLPS